MFWKYSGFKCYVCNVQQQQNATNITKISCRIQDDYMICDLCSSFLMFDEMAKMVHITPHQLELKITTHQYSDLWS